ncbi:F-box only protein 36 isoform X1 [Arapaima gigas]
MASLLGELLFQISEQGPAPSKDFYHLGVTKSEVIWRWWKISLRSEYRNTQPGEVKESHKEFMNNTSLQHKVRVVFGESILQYVIGLCEGRFDYLDRMPDPLILRIMAFLGLREVLLLRCMSSKYKKLCDCDKFWEQTARCHWGNLTPEMESLANILGWKKTFIAYKQHEEEAEQQEKLEKEEDEQQEKLEKEEDEQQEEPQEEDEKQPVKAEQDEA